MSITVMLPPETERKLVERAARNGQDIETCACELIQRGVSAEPTIDEILAPFRRQVAESGMSDEELSTFFEETREEVHREKQRASQ